MAVQSAKKPVKAKRRLGELLIEAGLIDEVQLTVALGLQKQTGLKLGMQLMKLGFIGEAELSQYLMDETDFNTPLTKRNISKAAIDAVPSELAFNLKVMPIAYAGKTIVMAMADPNDLKLLDNLAFRLGKQIHAVKALEWDIDNALLKYYKHFSDEELAMLTNTSSVAQQYESMQWDVGGEGGYGDMSEAAKGAGVQQDVNPFTGDASLQDAADLLLSQAFDQGEAMAEASDMSNEMPVLETFGGEASRPAAAAPVTSGAKKARSAAAEAGGLSGRPSAPVQEAPGAVQQRTPSPKASVKAPVEALEKAPLKKPVPPRKTEDTSLVSALNRNARLQKAIIEILVEKGILTKKEIQEALNSLKK